MPKQISVLQIGWKTSFNQKGEIMQSQPHVLTLWVNPDYHPAGLMMPVGSFPFSEVEKAIRQLPEYKKASGNMLSDLRNRSYFAYFVATSGIQAAHAAKAI